MPVKSTNRYTLYTPTVPHASHNDVFWQTPDISVTICITTSDGVNVTKVSIEPTVDTVQQLYSRIGEIIQIPVRELLLRFAGQELKRDGRTLEKHGVMGESKLHLVLSKTRATHMSLLLR